MNQLFNMSDFSKNKRMIFENGNSKIINPALNEVAIEFYTLDQKRLKTIQEVIKDLDEGIVDNTEFMYIILPHIASVNMDITLEEYIEMNMVYPCIEFGEFINYVIKNINEISTLGESMMDTLQEAQKLLDNPQAKNLIELKQRELEMRKKAEQEKKNQETDKIEQKIKDLYAKWESESDRNKKREYMKQINILDEQINKIE